MERKDKTATSHIPSFAQPRLWNAKTNSQLGRL